MAVTYAAAPFVNPVRACVGERGARVKQIIHELGNEPIDIFEWSDHLPTIVANAFKPLRARYVEVGLMQGVAEVVMPEAVIRKAVGA